MGDIKMKLYLFDQTYETEANEEEVRIQMQQEGYIEGLEWGFIREELK